VISSFLWVGRGFTKFSQYVAMILAQEHFRSSFARAGQVGEDAVALLISEHGMMPGLDEGMTHYAVK